jgi:hypothetical protein
MAFTVQDYSDLVQLLAVHPEWQAELRRLLLTEDFLALPGIVRQLAEAQRRTETRLEALATRLEELAEAQRRTETRLEALAARLEELAEAQRRTETRLEELAEAQRRTETRLEELIQAQKPIRDDLGTLKGERLERRYVSHAAGYFGKWLHRLRLIWPGGTLETSFEETLETYLTDEEILEILRLDAIIRGKPRQVPDATEVWLAVEISSVVDQGDVERARRRAALLRKAGFPAIPVVAGESLTQGATEAVRDAPVVVVLDGKSMGWEAALKTENGSSY